MFRWDEWAYCRPIGDGPFSAAGWRRCPWWMDRRHVELIYRLAMDCGLRIAVEIGGRRGSSTAALVQAVTDGALGELVVAEPAHTAELEKVITAGGDRTRWHRGAGLECLGPNTQFLVWDGDHTWATVEKEWEVVRSLSVPLWIAHDVCVSGVAEIDGPPRLLELVRECGEWRLWLDALARPGEWTERGLLVACLVPELGPVIDQAWAAMLAG